MLPGASVTVASPALLGGARVVVTTGTGSYRIPNIPVGRYKVTFELSGFNTKIYEGLRIQANTTFTIDVELGVAGVQESVTVSGHSPMIESAATDVGFTVTSDLMDAVPNGRDLWAVVSQVPGLTMSAGVGTGVNVGGTQTGNQLLFRGHGADSRQNVYLLNGADVTGPSAAGSSQFYFDVDSFEELRVEINSHSAEIQSPGIVVSVVPKSGTNQWKGSVNLNYGDDRVQSSNVDDTLRGLGVDRASNLHQYFDTGFELGGPLVKNKLFVWGAFRYQEVESFITGTRNPDGTFPIDRTYLWYPSAKLNWQINSKNNFSAYFNMAQKVRFKRDLSALRPVETTWDQRGAPVATLFTFRDDWTASPKLLVSIKANVMAQGFELRAQKGVDVANTPARFEQATGKFSAAPPFEQSTDNYLRAVGATVNYYVDRWLGGSHDFKFGADLNYLKGFGNMGGGAARRSYPADHRLIFFNGQPSEVILFAPGPDSVTNPNRSAFAQDSWTLGRLKLNPGVRWDWQANTLNEVSGPKTRFFEPVKQEKISNLIVSNTVSPRFGIVYDVTGKATTLLKASASRYYWKLWQDKGRAAGVSVDRSARYRWNDVNGDQGFTIGESGALLELIDPATLPVTADPNLKPTLTDEFTFGISHELMANLSVSGTYMHRKDRNLPWQNDFDFIAGTTGVIPINRAISPSDYTPVVGTDPGPDGRRGTADDGGPITFYELARSKIGLSRDFITNRQGFTQEYQGFEAAIYRRLVNKWQAVGSLTLGVQRENYGPGSFQNPQDIDKLDGTRVATSVPYIFKLMGSYELRHGIMVSGFYQYIAGTNFTRTANSASAVGRALNQGNVVALADRRNQESYDPLSLLDFRVSYDRPLAKAQIGLMLDIFNALNVNTITQKVTLSGPSFGRVLNFIPPRILRFGLKVRF